MRYTVEGLVGLSPHRVLSNFNVAIGEYEK